jgi:N-acetylmuramoyl-L-alanine amidase
MKNPRNIKYIVVHCTATPTNTTLESIKQYWKEVRKWGDTPGYHYFIKRDGTIVQLLDEKKNSFGVFHHNPECISIAYLGGIDKDGKPIDNRSDSQKHAMFDKIVELTERYPGAEVLGHRDFPGVAKACPCFDVKEWLKNYEPDLGQAA